MRNAVFLEEHMLSAAKADAFSSESTSLDRIAWDISIGTHAKFAKWLRPAHELFELCQHGRIRWKQLLLPFYDPTRSAVESNSVIFFEHLPFYPHFAHLLVHIDAFRTRHAAFNHVTCDNCVVTCNFTSTSLDGVSRSY